MPDTRWGPAGFGKTIGEGYNRTSLHNATAPLSLGTRQKIYAYLRRGGTFKRGSWDGCVMNATSDGLVRSISAAAAYFNEPTDLIANFIAAWDSTTLTANQKAASNLLESVLLNIGLTTESPKAEAYNKVSVYKVRLFTSAETKMVEELRDEIDAGAFDEDLAKIEELCLV